MTFRSSCFAACLMLFASSAQADVVRLMVEKREAFANQGRPYEKLTGRFYGELNVGHPLNAIIRDIEHAPRNARGLVEYSATFTILKPVDMAGATGVLFYQVQNRGRAGIEGGGYFADFRSQGHVLVASGWQADIATGAGIETLVTAIAKHADGSSITGPVMSRITVPRLVPVVSLDLYNAGRWMRTNVGPGCADMPGRERRHRLLAAPGRARQLPEFGTHRGDRPLRAAAGDGPVGGGPRTGPRLGRFGPATGGSAQPG